MFFVLLLLCTCIKKCFVFVLKCAVLPVLKYALFSVLKCAFIDNSANIMTIYKSYSTVMLTSHKKPLFSIFAV